MDKIIVFDTSYGTSNLGDFIINESINRQMEDIFTEKFVIRYPTHTPIIHWYQGVLRDTWITKNCSEARWKFLAGTNLFKRDLFIRTPDWNVNLFTARPYRESIAIGCGVDGDGKTQNMYTRMLYKRMLSYNYIHSVRDDKTKHFLEALGVEAINTGCPTTWSLTDEHCAKIATTKANEVVFTLTDYNRDIIKDQQLIDALLANYEKVHFWIQGTEDFLYFKSLKNTEDIVLVEPNLKAYSEILKKGSIDYVGTRLHAGIYAMQYKIRSIILIVDNRARDMQQSYNINAIERDDIDQLEAKINSNFATEVKIDVEKIDQWKSQFTR